MKLLHVVQKVALTVAVCAVTTGAMAATQGEVGPTSQGDFEIYYNQGTYVRIWGLEDVSLNNNKTSQKFTFCTYSNNTTKVQFTLSSRNGDFQLDTGSSTTSLGSTTAIPYKVMLDDKGNAEEPENYSAFWGFTGHKSNELSPFQFQTQGTASDGACTGTAQTTVLKVSIPSLPDNLSDGAYSDVVTLTVRPI